MKTGMTSKGRKFHLGIPIIWTDAKKLMGMDELVPEWKRLYHVKSRLSQAYNLALPSMRVFVIASVQKDWVDSTYNLYAFLFRFHWNLYLLCIETVGITLYELLYGFS